MLRKDFVLLLCLLQFVSSYPGAFGAINGKCKRQSVKCVCQSESWPYRRREIQVTFCSKVSDVCRRLVGLGKCASPGSSMAITKVYKRDIRRVRADLCPPYPSGPLGLPVIQRNSPKTLNKDVDDNVDLTCTVKHSNPQPNVFWLKETKEGPERISDDSRHLQSRKVHCQPTLTIKRLSVHDKGNYTCAANNSYGLVKGTPIYISVRLPKGPSVIEMGIYGRHPGDLDVAYFGNRINLTCKVDLGSNEQLGSACIFRNGLRVYDEPGKYENFPSIEDSIFTNILEISNVSHKDEGKWTCFGLRSGMNTTKSFYLRTAPCPSGYYCPPWKSNKMRCPEGTYSQIGSISCTSCPGGYYCPFKTRDRVIPCPPGYFCPPNSDSLKPCLYGTYSGNGSVNCTQCPGKVAPERETAKKQPAKSLSECPTEEKAANNDESAIASWIIPVAVLAVLVPVLLFGFVCYYRWHHRPPVDSNSSGALLNDVNVTLVGEVAVSPSNGFHGNLRNGNHRNGVVQMQLVTQSEECPEYPSSYDVFICYSSKDIKFAKQIQEELERQGYKCCIDLRDFMPGEAIVVNIANAIYHSKNTLAILSPDFINSEWCKQELFQALTRNIRYHQVIPILFRDCEVPVELKHRTYLDYLNCYVKPYFWYQLKKCLGKGRLQSEGARASVT